MIDAAKRASARHIIAVIPYFGWARQDRKDKPRVSIGAKLVADLLSVAGIDRLITMDLHADQIQGFFNVSVDHLYASGVLLPYVQGLHLKDLVIASPDVGGSKRANTYAKYLGCPLVLCNKTRARANEVASMQIIGDVKDKNVVIVDDIEFIKESIKNLKSDGGVTNPGDGLRYGMVSLQKQHAQLKYVVLLTDGVPNAYLVNQQGQAGGLEMKREGIQHFNNVLFELSSNVPASFNYGRLGYDYTSKIPDIRDASIDYAGAVSKAYGVGVKRVNVIGFSGLEHEIAYGQNLTDKIGEGGMETKYVSATNKEALQKTFSDIKKQIQQDLWFVSGP